MSLTDGTPAVELDDETDYDDVELTGYQGRLASLRAEKGVVRLRYGSIAGFVLLRYDDVLNAFRDDVRFSESKMAQMAVIPFLGPNILGFDGHEHTVRRKLVSPDFKRSAISRYVEPILRPTADELIDEIAPLGEADLMATFNKKYPMRVITRILGIPRDDEDTMASWAKAMLNMTREPEAARTANAAFTDYIAPLIDERRARPGDDLLSAIATEEVDGQRLDDEEVFGFSRLLFPAGVDTTWLQLGNLVATVLKHPEVLPRLRNDAEDRRWAVEETLRWEPSVGGAGRITLEDVVVSGVEIPAGEFVRLSTAVANRDPDAFPDPDRWDLDRRTSNHLAFGFGRHFCLGAFLARGEMEVALELLLSRLPNLRLIEDAPVRGVSLRSPKTLRVAWDAE